MKCHRIQEKCCIPLWPLIWTESPKCHGCCHQAMFLSFCLFSLYLFISFVPAWVQPRHWRHNPVPFALCLCLFHFNGCLCLFENTVPSKSPCMAAPVDPLQPSKWICLHAFCSVDPQASCCQYYGGKYPDINAVLMVLKVVLSWTSTLTQCGCCTWHPHILSPYQPQLRRNYRTPTLGFLMLSKPQAHCRQNASPPPPFFSPCVPLFHTQINRQFAK